MFGEGSFTRLCPIPVGTAAAPHLKGSVADGNRRPQNGFRTSFKGKRGAAAPRHEGFFPVINDVFRLRAAGCFDPVRGSIFASFLS